MLQKNTIRYLISSLTALALFATPSIAMAGGVCGGAYTAEAGDTVDKLAAMCGTTTDAIYAANPGINNKLTVGQTLIIPGLTYSQPNLPPPVITPPSPQPQPYPYPYPTDPANAYYPQYGNSGTYIVQWGDTFSSIANRFGVSFYALLYANPQIWSENLIYAGQTLYIPAPNLPAGYTPVAQPEPSTLTWSTVNRNTPNAVVILSNKSGGDVYISLHTSRADGTNAIHEYPVNGTINVDIPVGWIDYVAWVGGVKYTGGFKLKEGDIHTITFNRSKVVVD